MKKILLAIVIAAFASYGNTLKAQCDIILENVAVSIYFTGPKAPVQLTSPNRCEITFDARFDIVTNSGFKFLFFHSWLVDDYPTPPIFNCTGSTPAVDPGTRQQLGQARDEAGKSFLDIGFMDLKDSLEDLDEGDSKDITVNFATTYFHDPGVELTKPSNSFGLKATVTKLGGDTLHFDVQNIKIIVAGICPTNSAQIEVKTDVWGSNSKSGDPKAQCYICGRDQLFNDPIITGFKNCDFPREYSLGVSTLQPGIFPITIKVFADMDDDGIIDDDGDNIFNESGEDIMVLGGLTPTPITHNLSIANPFSTGDEPVTYEPYSSTPIVSGRDLLVLVEGSGLVNGSFRIFETPFGCIPLPVDIKSFNANRSSHTTVQLKWETTTEQNAYGFSVERNIGGTWQDIAFVPTQASGGNSSSLLTYSYTDVNNFKGMTQYRIKQVDRDSHFKYSIIRAVRGDGQTGKTLIYPNPTSDGRVTVVFEDATVIRDVSLFDMTGRSIKQWKAVTNNNIQIENLGAGVYSLRIVVPETGASSVEKIVVNKR